MRSTPTPHDLEGELAFERYMTPLLLALRAIAFAATSLSIACAFAALRSSRTKHALWWTIVAAAMTLGALQLRSHPNIAHDRSATASRVVSR